MADTYYAQSLEAWAALLLAHGPLSRLSDKEVRRIEDIELVQRAAGVFVDDGTGNVVHEDSTRERLTRGLRALRRRVRSSPPRALPPAEPVCSNLAVLGRALELDDVDLQVLTFVHALQTSDGLQELVMQLGNMTLADCAETLCRAQGLERRQVMAALHRTGRLRASGVIQVDDDLCTMQHKLKLWLPLVDLLTEPALDELALLEHLVPRALPPTLGLDDFVHMRREVDLALGLLRGALEQRARGINILLTGDTGTGKTEQARVLAASLQVCLHQAGQADRSGESPAAPERLSALMAAHSLLGRSRALVLFDEVEDLFREGQSLSFFARPRSQGLMSKQWFNLLLERNSVPTIWIANDVGIVDDAYLRRFSLSIRFQAAGVRTRTRALRGHLGTEHALSEQDIATIAERNPASPAQLAQAVTCARLLSDDGRPARAAIEQVLASSIAIMTGRDPRLQQVFDPASYDVEVINSPDDVQAIARKLASWQPGGPGGGLTLCLYGAPGTGKSAYARHLAWRMGRPVLCRHASDIVSPWVGVTEQNIARAFARALEDDALLLFDEADSFLRDRRHAERSWEVTEVNEFLQQLESHPGLVVCTTNLWHDIDQAALRRFVFKAEFRWLRPEQALRMFERTLARHLDRPLDDDARAGLGRELGRLPCLAPGSASVAASSASAATGRSSPPRPAASAWWRSPTSPCTPSRSVGRSRRARKPRPEQTGKESAGVTSSGPRPMARR
jgi:AAA+ superfamily predicted ATPase